VKLNVPFINPVLKTLQEKLPVKAIRSPPA